MFSARTWMIVKVEDKMGRDEMSKKETVEELLGYIKADMEELLDRNVEVDIAKDTIRKVNEILEMEELEEAGCVAGIPRLCPNCKSDFTEDYLVVVCNEEIGYSAALDPEEESIDVWKRHEDSGCELKGVYCSGCGKEFEIKRTDAADIEWHV